MWAAFSVKMDLAFGCLLLGTWPPLHHGMLFPPAAFTFTQLCVGMPAFTPELLLTVQWKAVGSLAAQSWGPLKPVVLTALPTGNG